MRPDERDVPCRYCGTVSLRTPTHIYGERKCCPDCDHRPTETWPVRAALIEALIPGEGLPEALLIADILMPVVAGIAADAMQAEADELRELALRCDEGERWNPHRVWTLLSDRADVWRERLAR